MKIHAPSSKTDRTPKCGASSIQVSDHVDAVSCRQCELLEGFRSLDLETASTEDKEARRALARAYRLKQVMKFG